MRTVSKSIWKAVIYAFLLVIAVFALFPVIYILLGSFKSNKEILVGGRSGILKTIYRPGSWRISAG